MPNTTRNARPLASRTRLAGSGVSLDGRLRSPMVNWSGAAGALPSEAALKAVKVPVGVDWKNKDCHPPSGEDADRPQLKGVAVSVAPAVPN